MSLTLRQLPVYKKVLEEDGGRVLKPSMDWESERMADVVLMAREVARSVGEKEGRGLGASSLRIAAGGVSTHTHICYLS